MKKFIMFLLSLFLVFSLVSCNLNNGSFATNPSTEENHITNKETNESQNNIQVTEKESQNNSTPDPDIYNYNNAPRYYISHRGNLILLAGGFAFTSYEEYRDLWAQVNYPEHFIRYEQIEDLGNFVKFDFNGGGKYSSIYKDYDFYLDDGSGQTIILKILHTDIQSESYRKYHRIEKQITESKIINKKDMRKLSVASGGYFEISGVRYYYYETGEIAEVVWKKGDVEFGLFCYPTSSYPYTSDTALGKLLNIEDNDPAEIVASITKNINVE